MFRMMQRSKIIDNPLTGDSCRLGHARGIKELCDGSEGGETFFAELFNETQPKGGGRLVGGGLGG